MFKQLLLNTVLIIIMGAASGAADLNATKSERFKVTLKDFMKFLKNQNYIEVWSLTSNSLKFGNENDQSKYESYIRSQGFHPIEFSVQKIVENSNDALVTVEVSYNENKSEKKYGSALEKWTFIYENGAWFFDTYVTLQEDGKSIN
jgi:hypothetical protein